MPFIRCALVAVFLVAFTAPAAEVCVTQIAINSLDLVFPEGHLFFQAGGQGRAVSIDVIKGDRFAMALAGPAVIIDRLPSLERGRQTPIHLLSNERGLAYGNQLIAEGTPLVLTQRNKTLEAIVVPPPHSLVVALADVYQDLKFLRRPTLFFNQWTSRERMIHERVHVGDRAGENPDILAFVESLNAVYATDKSLGSQLSALDTFVRELRAYDAEYSELRASTQETIVVSGETQNVRAADLEKLKSNHRRLKAYPIANADYVALMERELFKFQQLVDASEGLMEAIEAGRNEFGNATVSFNLYRLVHTLEIEMSLRQYAFQANAALNEVRAKNPKAHRAILAALQTVSARTEVTGFQLAVLLPEHFVMVK